MRKRYIIYMITSIFLPALFQLYATKVSDNNGAFSWLNFFLLSVCCMTIAFIIEFVLFGYARIKNLTPTQLLEKIERTGQQYLLPNDSAMFYIRKTDYCLLFADEQNESRLKQNLMNSKHIIYHSLSAKEHLNWIEYVIWSFLRTLKDAYGCKIIIAIHFDEDSRENGIYSDQAKERYNHKFQQLSSIAYKLLGRDIQIVDEIAARRTKEKFFSKHYHNIFVKYIITNIRALAEGRLAFDQFMRKVSHIESVFPIMMLSKNRGKRNRLYILDRTDAHSVWDESPLKEYKDSHNIFFIYSQTLTYSDGNPIRIFHPNDTINITDNLQDIQQKLNMLDGYTKLIILRLLIASSGIHKKNSEYLDSQQIDATILQLIKDAKSQYAL